MTKCYIPVPKVMKNGIAFEEVTSQKHLGIIVTKDLNLQSCWQKTDILHQMPPKVICGTPMTKICIFLVSKMPKTLKKTSKYIFALNVVKGHFTGYNDQNILFAETKLPKLGKNCKETCLYQMPPKDI